MKKHYFNTPYNEYVRLREQQGYTNKFEIAELMGISTSEVDTLKDLYEYEVWKYEKEHCNKTEDVVNHPSHYETGKFECFDIMREIFGDEAVMNFCICNAFKYVYRHKNKNGLEDLQKSIWYLKKYEEINKELNPLKGE